MAENPPSAPESLRNTYDPETGSYIDESGQGYSTAFPPENAKILPPGSHKNFIEQVKKWVRSGRFYWRKKDKSSEPPKPPKPQVKLTKEELYNLFLGKAMLSGKFQYNPYLTNPYGQFRDYEVKTREIEPGVVEKRFEPKTKKIKKEARVWIDPETGKVYTTDPNIAKQGQVEIPVQYVDEKGNVVKTETKTFEIVLGVPQKSSAHITEQKVEYTIEKPTMRALYFNEQEYRQHKDIQELQSRPGWQQAGLVGAGLILNPITSLQAVYHGASSFFKNLLGDKEGAVKEAEISRKLFGETYSTEKRLVYDKKGKVKNPLEYGKSVLLESEGGQLFTIGAISWGTGAGLGALTRAVPTIGRGVGWGLGAYAVKEVAEDVNKNILNAKNPLQAERSAIRNALSIGIGGLMFTKGYRAGSKFVGNRLMQKGVSDVVVTKTESVGVGDAISFQGRYRGLIKPDLENTLKIRGRFRGIYSDKQGEAFTRFIGKVGKKKVDFDVTSKRFFESDYVSIWTHESRFGKGVSATLKTNVPVSEVKFKRLGIVPSRSKYMYVVNDRARMFVNPENQETIVHELLHAKYPWLSEQEVQALTIRPPRRILNLAMKIQEGKNVNIRVPVGTREYLRNYAFSLSGRTFEVSRIKSLQKETDKIMIRGFGEEGFSKTLEKTYPVLRDFSIPFSDVLEGSFGKMYRQTTLFFPSLNQTKVGLKEKVFQTFFGSNQTIMGLKFSLRELLRDRTKGKERVEVKETLRVEQKERTRIFPSVRNILSFRTSQRTEDLVKPLERFVNLTIPRVETVVKPRESYRTRSMKITQSLVFRPFEVLVPFRFPVNARFTKLRKTGNKSRKMGLRRVIAKKTILADPLSVMISRLRFGKATHPKPTRELWNFAEKTFFLKIPTVEELVSHKKGKRQKKKRKKGGVSWLV